MRSAPLAALLLVFAAKAAAQPRLTRQEAVRLGLERNLPLLVQRLELRRAEQQQSIAWQPYHPVLSLDGAWVRSAASGLGPQVDSAAQLAWRSPLGTQVGASALWAQPLGGSSNPGAAAVGLSVVQPLLRDAWRAGASLPLAEAELSIALQRELFRLELQQFLLELETDYWDLALAFGDLAIKRTSRQRAQQQYEDTAENIRRGILSPADLYVVEDNLVFFEQELVRAEESLRVARRRLRERLQLTDAAVELAEDLRPIEVPLPTRDEVLQRALRQHPASAAQRLRLERADLRLAHAARQSLPNLDTVAALTLRATDAPASSAWSELWGNPTPDARLGLHFSVPLDRSGLRAAEEGARLELAREKAQENSVRSVLAVAAENAVSQLETQLKLSQLAGKQVKLAELKLQAEVEKYKTGISRLPEVVRFQRELDAAQLSLQRTLRSLHLARAQLLAAQGMLAEAWGVGVGR